MTAPAAASRIGPTTLAEFRRLIDESRTRMYTRTERVPLCDLPEWDAGPAAAVISHHSGRFFTVQGLAVSAPGHPVPGWDQPIIHQPETGILGILVTEWDGVRHLLVQLKPEPGNRDGLQVSPTVQATRSNYTRVHGGAAVPYLEHFTNAARHHVLADVRQSEHGSWFLRKRNRNMIVQTSADVPVVDGFGWLPLPALHRLLAEDDLVNADTRSVLACLPPAGAAVERSRHSTADLLSWITDGRAGTRIGVRPVPLGELSGWHRDAERITHRSGRFFDVIGVRVEAAGREVSRWGQPMFAPHGTGVVAFLVTRIEGALHVLTQLRAEPGSADVAELAPTVQCTPENHTVLPAAARPRFLDDVLRADAAAIRFDTVLSDEGGRFYHSRSRHLIIETPWIPEPPSHRWMTVPQLRGLLRHSCYVNMQARSLLACLGTLGWAAP